MDVRVGWAKFDAASPDVRVGWAEFDALAAPFSVRIGWAEFDCRSPNDAAVPPFVPGGGVARYHSDANQKYEIPVLAVDEDEEEQIILAVLMEVAAHAVL